MVRLTAQLINMSAQKHNPVRDWELDLRGYRIPLIENVGATLDQFDTIDFTDNDIRRLDKFPLLKRLKHILLSNNRIVRISEDLQETLPSLETLILTKNCLKDLSDIDALGSITTLKYLSLLDNPLVTKKNYRLYVIHKIPSLRVLDFSRIKMKERQLASKLYKKKKSQQPAQATMAAAPTENGTKTFVPGEMLQSSRVPSTGPNKQDVAAIKKAIANAQTLEEIERLNQLLKSGHIPGREVVAPQTADAEMKEEQEEEEEEEDEEEEEEETAPTNQPSHFKEEMDMEEEEEDDDEEEEEEEEEGIEDD